MGLGYQTTSKTPGGKARFGISETKYQGEMIREDTKREGHSHHEDQSLCKCINVFIQMGEHPLHEDQRLCKCINVFIQMGCTPFTRAKVRCKCINVFIQMAARFTVNPTATPPASSHGNCRQTSVCEGSGRTHLRRGWW